MRYLFVITALLILNFASGQKKELDLESAILKQRSSLAPDDVRGITWIDKEIFTHYGDNGVLYVKNSKGQDLTIISPNDINTALNNLGVDSIKSVRPYEWKNSENFYFKVKREFFEYNYKTGDLAQVVRAPEGAANITLAPASGNIAYTLDNNVYVATGTENKIAVTSFKKESGISAGIAIHRSEFGITNGLFWSEDGNTLGFYEMDESMVTEYPLANYRPYPAESNMIRYPMAGQASHHARVGVFDVDEKRLVYLDTKGPKDQYLTNFTFSPDGQLAYLAIVNREQNQMNLKAFSSSTGELTTSLFEEKDEKYVEPEHPPKFLPDGTFLWFSERDGFNQLYHYKQSGELISKVTSGNYDVKNIICLADNDKAVIVEAAEGTMNEAIYKVNIASGKARKLDERKGIYGVSGRDNSNLVIKYRSYQVPNEVNICTSSGKVLYNLMSSENPLVDYQIGEIEFEEILASDSTILQTRLIKPFDFDSTKSYPVLVYVYGGPHVQLIRNDYKGGAPLWMHYAANKSYIVFTVDGRGTAYRGIDFEQATYRQLGTVELEDQLEGVEYLQSLPYVDASRMAIHGWSFGGFMTLSMMLRNPDVFQVGVAGGPVTDWDLYEVMYTERYMDTPEDNKEGYEKADLKNYASNLEGDVLIIHGLDDDVVVPQHSYTLLETFVKEQRQVDFYVYPGHKHNVRGKDRVHLMQKVLDYIDLHLE